MYVLSKGEKKVERIYILILPVAYPLIQVLPKGVNLLGSFVAQAARGLA